MTLSRPISRRSCLQLLGVGAATLVTTRWPEALAATTSPVDKVPTELTVGAGEPLLGRRSRSCLPDGMTARAADVPWQSGSPEVQTLADANAGLVLRFPDGERVALSALDFQCGRAQEYLRARFGDSVAQRIGDQLLASS